jgi:hypothetical protein
MQIKEHLLEIIRQLFKWRTGQPTDPEEIKRRIKDLERMVENDEKRRNQQSQ